MNTRLLSGGMWCGLKSRTIILLGQVSCGVSRSVSVQKGRHYFTGSATYNYQAWLGIPRQRHYTISKTLSAERLSLFTGVSRVISRKTRITTTTTTSKHLSNSSGSSSVRFSTSSRVFNSNTTTSTSNGESPQKMGALKRLVTVYGRLGLIAYLGVSVVDYACCYLMVRAAGEERVTVMEKWLKEHLGRFSLFPSKVNDNKQDDGVGSEVLDVEDRVQDEAARERALVRKFNHSSDTTKSNASAATLLLVAYGIHKLIMPLRLGFTALILPPMVKRFGHISWLVGKNAATATKAAKRSPSTKL